MVPHHVDDVPGEEERCVFRQCDLRVTRMNETAASLVLATHDQIRRITGRLRRRDVIVATTTAAHDASANHVPLKQSTTSTANISSDAIGRD